MGHGEFIWCDLSTYDLQACRGFYSELMGWQIFEKDSYTYWTKNGEAVAGHFSMPDPFRKIGMPPFWMTYISTRDIDATVGAAKALGCKIEISPTPFDDHGEFALIRDPCGAGFSVYEGEGLTLQPSMTAGKRAGHALHVTKPADVLPVYKDLFSWRFEQVDHTTWYGLTETDFEFTIYETPISPTEKTPQYWEVQFCVDDLKVAHDWALRDGALLLDRRVVRDKLVHQFLDSEGAAFSLTHVRLSAPKYSKDKNSGFGNMWRF